MNLAEALRKIRLLSRITRNGASAAEAETAANLARSLMERFAILAEDARPARVAPARLTWIYWESLLEEFDIKLKRSGRRGTARLDSGLLVFIRLDTGQWSVKKQGRMTWPSLQATLAWNRFAPFSERPDHAPTPWLRPEVKQTGSVKCAR